MKRYLFVCLLPLLLVSCRSLTPLNPSEVERVRVACEAARPPPFEARQSWAIEFQRRWWKSDSRLTARGYARVEPQTRGYEGVCELTAGGKLFEVVRTNGENDVQITTAIFGDPQVAGRIIGKDINRLFFDWVPPPDATVSRKGAHLLFRSRRDQDWIEYEFDILTTRPVGKTIFQNGQLSTVILDDYQYYSSGPYPAVMKLINHSHRYSLTVRNLAIRPAR